jgi:hypothetical protein
VGRHNSELCSSKHSLKLVCYRVPHECNFGFRAVKAQNMSNVYTVVRCKEIESQSASLNFYAALVILEGICLC